MSAENIQAAVDVARLDGVVATTKEHFTSTIQEMKGDIKKIAASVSKMEHSYGVMHWFATTAISIVVAIVIFVVTKALDGKIQF